MSRLGRYLAAAVSVSLMLMVCVDFSMAAGRDGRQNFTAEETPGKPGVSGAVPASGLMPRAGGGDAERSRPLTAFLDVFNEAAHLVKEHYLTNVSGRDLVYGAIRGMLETLDVNSQFFTPEELARLRAETEGEFVGIGAKVKFEAGALQVSEVIEGSPASEEDFRVGDQIIEIDHTPVSPLDPQSSLEKLKGANGQSVVLTVKRTDTAELLEKRVKRKPVEIRSVSESRIVADGVGYLKITKFGEQSRTEVESAAETLKFKGAQKLILDVRDNPGGTLEAVSEVASLFLEKGKLIVSIEARRREDRQRLYSKAPNPFDSMPLVVLINGKSASASEVLASALKDHRRATLIGKKSYGKGSVQILLSLEDGSAMRITTAEYRTPLGVSIHQKGIEPDIEVDGENEQIAKAIEYFTQ